jgi:hypothetical protein
MDRNPNGSEEQAAHAARKMVEVRMADSNLKYERAEVHGLGQPAQLSVYPLRL